MLENGYIKIYRSILTWEWYNDSNTSRLFWHLLLTVNYEDKKWQGKTILRGQRITSVSKLVAETGLSTKNIRTSLDKLKKTGEVAIETANRYSLITIANYDKYQGSDSLGGKQTGEQSANEGQTNGKQVANKGQLRKKDKKDKKAEEIKEASEPPQAAQSKFVPPTDDEVQAYCESRGNNVDAEQFVAFYASKGWKVGNQ